MRILYGSELFFFGSTFCTAINKLLSYKEKQGLKRRGFIFSINTLFLQLSLFRISYCYIYIRACYNKLKQQSKHSSTKSTKTRIRTKLCSGSLYTWCHFSFRKGLFSCEKSWRCFT